MDSKALYLLLFVLLSAFFSGSEMAMFSLSRVYLKKLENSGDKSGRLVIRLLTRPKRLLVTLLLCNTFVNMAISSFSTLLAIRLAGTYGWNLSYTITIQIILVTTVILIFGEIVPKLIALSLANEISLWIAYPLHFIQFVLGPIVWIFEKLSAAISRKGNVDHHISQRFTHEEFHNLIHSESSSGSLEEHEKRMLVGLFRFREAEISEIYVPRVKITAIEETQSLDELKALAISSGYSRIPVYRETIDDIIGIIYVKDLLLYPDKESLTELMRPVWFITENMKVQSLLNQFKLKKRQVAVVVDEYGGTSGIISLEDILEEIVGEIQDEYDSDEIPEFVKITENDYEVSGNFSVRQFNQEFSREISVDEYDNLAEFLLAQFNHVPEVGEEYDLDEKLNMEILESDERSIKKIRVRCHL